MSDVKKIFKEKKFPSFIANHSIFHQFKEIKKVFPEIGLPNTEKEIEVDNRKEAKAVAGQVLAEINQMIDNRLRTINKYGTKKSDAMGNKRKKKLENINLLLTAVKEGLGRKRNDFIVDNNGRITLNLPSDIVDAEGKVIFKQGEGLFRVYNKLNEVLRGGHFLAMEKLENLPQFKEFSSKNVPSLKYKVCFSSDGSTGAWDIATMSMRGISSCQTWGSANSTHVVGSVVDPFTAIIYLTNGSNPTEYGSKMIRRCIVRFMVDEKKKLPFIALERMYPSQDNAALETFISFLKEATDNKFEVVYIPGSTKVYNGSYVPMSRIVSQLSAYDQPYRDSGVAYKADVTDIQRSLRHRVQERISSTSEAIAAKTLAAARAIKIGSIPVEDRKSFKSLRGTNYSMDLSYYLYDAVLADIKKFLTERIDKYTDGDLFAKESLEALLASGIETRLTGILKSFMKGTPVYDYYGGKELFYGKIEKQTQIKLSEGTIKTFAAAGAEKINAYLTAEIAKIKILDKSAAKKSNPAESAIPIYTKLLD